MNRRNPVCFTALAIFILAFTALAHAAPQRTFVSAQRGNDANAVSAGSTDTVVLRGLTLTGLGGSYGITVTSVGSLHVEGSVISGFSGIGIFANLAADGGQVFIKDTITRDNGQLANDH